MKKTSGIYLVWMSLVFFTLMLLDAHFTRLFGMWDKGNNLWQSQVLLLTMLFSSYRLPKAYMLPLSIVIGIIFDLYYLSLIGVYAVALPLVVWMMYLFHRSYYQNIFALFFSWIITLTMTQLVVLGIQLVFKLNIFHFAPYIVHSFGPTLLVNILWFILLFIPFRRIFKVDISLF